MKPTSLSLALFLSATATPALAQYGSSAPPTQPRIPQPTVQQKEGEEQPANQATDSGARPSKGAQKAIVALQQAITTNDAAAYPAALAAAKAAATTNQDRYIIARLQLNKAFADKDNVSMKTAIDEIAAAQVLDNATVANLYTGLGSALYSAKQFDQAAAAFERGLALDPNNVDSMTNLAESRFAMGRKAEAVPLLQKVVATRVAAGQKPAEALYRRMFEIAYDSKLPNSVEIGRQWVAAYPNATSWRNALAVYQNVNKPGVEEVLNLLRLMRATGALSNPADFSLYATAAADQGNYVEAQAVIDEGLSKSAINANDRLIKEIIDGLKGKPKATAADLAVATKDAKTGTAFVRIGDRYFGMGDYAKAIELYRMAEGKPGADPNLVNMHLGMALARSGDKAGAVEAFKKVSGPNAQIAQYWTIYVNQAA
jgi:tetratricopeptide (TPR) repeat protein